MRPPGPGGTNGAGTAVAAEYFRNSRRLISDVLSARHPLPLCPQCQTYCCVAPDEPELSEMIEQAINDPPRGRLTDPGFGHPELIILSAHSPPWTHTRAWFVRDRAERR